MGVVIYAIIRVKVKEVLHMKYSHSKIPDIKMNEDPVVRCGICKKKNCKLH